MLTRPSLTRLPITPAVGSDKRQLRNIHRNPSRLISRQQLSLAADLQTQLTFFLPTLRHLMPETRHFQVQRAFLRRRGRLS